jgi:hypothetical protein
LLLKSFLSFLKTLVSIGQLTHPEIPDGFDLTSQCCENLIALSFVSLPVYIDVSNLFGRLCMLRLWPSLRNFVLIGGICSGSNFIAIKKNNQLGFLQVLNN